MKFTVQKEVFDKLGDACFGVVVAEGIDNREKLQAIEDILNQNVNAAIEKLQNTELKQYPAIAAYREAFTRLGINPNKYLCSIEALMKRVLKGGEFPKINSIVDIANAVSVRHIIPIGAHDIDSSTDDIEIRFSNADDIFLPFGAEAYEKVDEGELVYVRGSNVKTRRWIWRQSDEGKITDSSTNIFFPIDGFMDRNYDSVIAARDELAGLLTELFGCRVRTGFVDRDNNTMVL